MHLVLVSQILKKEWTTYSSVALGSTRISECFFRQKTVLPLTNELDLEDNPSLDIQLYIKGQCIYLVQKQLHLHQRKSMRIGLVLLSLILNSQSEFPSLMALNSNATIIAPPSSRHHHHSRVSSTTRLVWSYPMPSNQSRGGWYLFLWAVCLLSVRAPFSLRSLSLSLFYHLFFFFLFFSLSFSCFWAPQAAIKKRVKNILTLESRNKSRMKNIWGNIIGTEGSMLLMDTVSIPESLAMDAEKSPNS